MTKVMASLRYSKEHEWVRLEGDIATIGITDYAQDSLGDVVFVEIHEANEEVNQGDEICVIESTKAASEVYSPVSGEIIEVNQEVIDNPELINQEPYAAGWLVKIRVSDPKEINNLFDNERYLEFIGE